MNICTLWDAFGAVCAYNTYSREAETVKCFPAGFHTCDQMFVFEGKLVLKDKSRT